MIKPIETRYAGYRFRSRLEARWGVFFNALGLSWEYEPEGFVLDDGTHYLPDFRVKTPQGDDIWYEVKRNGVLEDAKFSSFLESMTDDKHPSFRAALLSGDPIDHFSRKWDTDSDGGFNTFCPRCGFIHELAYGVTLSDISEYGEDCFGCMPCDFETPSGGDHASERGVFCYVRPHKGWVITPPGAYEYTVRQKINSAAQKSRSARFEHGVSGA